MKEVTVILMGTQPIPSLQQCCHAHSNVQEFLKVGGGGRGGGREGRGKLQKSYYYPTAPIYKQKPISCSQY